MKFVFILLLLCSCHDFTERNLIPESAPVMNDNQALLKDFNSINQGEFTPEKLIANIGVNVITPTVMKLGESINDLDSSFQQYCDTLEVFDETNFDLEKQAKLLISVQSDWKASMQAYHQLAMMNFGPSAKTTSTALDSIYSFDQVDKCRVDLALLQYSSRKRLPRFDVINNYNVRGLDALEALIFADQSKTLCKRPNTRITEYYKKPLLERAKTSCGYGKHLFEDIKLKTNELVSAWSLQQGFYTQKLLEGVEGNPIDVVNKISQSLFFLDTNTKDIKMAFPAGFEVAINGTVTKCPDDSCPDSREHLYANYSYQAMLASLNGFKSLFLGLGIESGTNGYGLDDLLSSRGHEDIAKSITENLDNLINKIEKLAEETSYIDLLAQVKIDQCEQTTSDNRINEACALVWDLRKVTNILKNEYLAALVEFNAPKQAQGDND